jgi:heat shock protein HslJ
MKIQNIWFTVAALFISGIILIPGCSAGDEALSLKSTKWELDSLTAITMPPLNKKSTVEFSGDGKLSGYGGCNSFGGRYKSSAGKLTTSDIYATEMACENMQVESNFISALMKNDTYKVKGSKLYLYSNGALTAILTKSPL